MIWNSKDKEVPALKAEIARLQAEVEHFKAYSTDLNAKLFAFGPPDYNEDYLRVYNKQLDFMTDPRFERAYRRGIESGHTIGAGGDIGIRYRIHSLTWAAQHAARLPGDFVECGVNTGIFSLAVMDYLDFDRLGKKFYLFDTFEGVPEEQMNEYERTHGHKEMHDFYFDCYAVAQRNFAPFASARMIRGRVPESLAEVEIEKVAYLSIDMNILEPELRALEHFWPKLVPGGIIVMDDYAWRQYAYRKSHYDDFARANGTEIFTLPTGQGLILKA
ncbi:TylF/MycF/NovP-related O-methyltransferase [Sediminicoccus sp. KRV36]|uniref:TylF/MycF/NovP-related O-methyltransferase n=1 Tax=Sediminicoccus sp. KRV36 TaxID=3133721 RepID=UPI00200C934D|nr:TylF/MycF/NovP-related O-methyltransferase [Sediminicoccus rosea]UPY38173.1 TylF/MycF family methyltransferase [Sediminicoccus rosea]